MKNLTSIIQAALLFTCLFSPISNALQISNGSLVVNVREDNGAVDSYILNGIDFFELGTHVSDWGMQVDTDASTFRINTTYGSNGIPVDVDQASANSVEVTGVYNQSGANVEVVRTLTVLPGFDALVFSYKLTNLDEFDSVRINIFETFDPDQGITTGHGYGTYNDVIIQDGFKIGQAVDQTGLAFMIASNDPRVIIAAGNPFQINNGSRLNSVIASPYDGDGAFADRGTHMVLSAVLEAEEVTVSIASGAVVEGDDPMDIIGQPVDNSVIEVIKETIGTGTLPDELLIEISLDDYIESFEGSGGTVIVKTSEVKDDGSGSTTYLVILISLLALYRRKTQ